jgi:hypothetical protein
MQKDKQPQKKVFRPTQNQMIMQLVQDMNIFKGVLSQLIENQKDQEERILKLENPTIIRLK